jgi:hypothetical protein
VPPSNGGWSLDLDQVLRGEQLPAPSLIAVGSAPGPAGGVTVRVGGGCGDAAAGGCGRLQVTWRNSSRSRSR